MKHSTLALCLLFPLCLTASSKKGGSPRKYVLPHGTTLEVKEQLVVLVDEEKSSPNSPVTQANLGSFGDEAEDACANDESLDSFILDGQSFVPSQAQQAERPLSPADRSPNWRAEPKRVTNESFPFGTDRRGPKQFVPAQPASPADASQNWRRDEKPSPRFIALGAAVHLCPCRGKQKNR